MNTIPWIALAVSLIAFVASMLALAIASRGLDLVHRLDAVVAPWLEFWSNKFKRKP